MTELLVCETLCETTDFTECKCELLVCETLGETTDFTECKCGYLLVVELKNRKVSSTAVLLRGTEALAAAPLIL